MSDSFVVPAEADSAVCTAPASESDDLESQPSGDEDLADRRLEDLTDSSEGSDEEDASAPGTSSTEDEEALAANQNPGQNGAADYWAPRRCKLCPGVLLLNPTSLQQHTASKKHRRLLGQDADDTFDPIVLAEEVEVSPKLATASSIFQLLHHLTPSTACRSLASSRPTQSVWHALDQQQISRLGCPAMPAPSRHPARSLEMERSAGSAGTRLPISGRARGSAQLPRQLAQLEEEEQPLGHSCGYVGLRHTSQHVRPIYAQPMQASRTQSIWMLLSHPVAAGLCCLNFCCSPTVAVQDHCLIAGNVWRWTVGLHVISCAQSERLSMSCCCVLHEWRCCH